MSVNCAKGGNKILADVGPWLKDTITARFQSMNLPLTIKYIDPTYMKLAAKVLAGFVVGARSFEGCRPEGLHAR